MNEEVLRDREVGKAVMSMDDAKKTGAMMFFGEKYGESVRVVDVPGFSTELCGGCHVTRTGEIGAFKVLSDKGLAAGVRRLEAVTSLNAVERLQKDEEILANMAQTANVAPDELPAKLRETLDSLRRKEKEIARSSGISRCGRALRLFTFQEIFVLFGPVGKRSDGVS